MLNFEDNIFRNINPDDSLEEFPEVREYIYTVPRIISLTDEQIKAIIANSSVHINLIAVGIEENKGVSRVLCVVFGGANSIFNNISNIKNIDEIRKAFLSNNVFSISKGTYKWLYDNDYLHFKWKIFPSKLSVMIKDGVPVPNCFSGKNNLLLDVISYGSWSGFLGLIFLKNTGRIFIKTIPLPESLKGASSGISAEFISSLAPEIGDDWQVWKDTSGHHNISNIAITVSNLDYYISTFSSLKSRQIYEDILAAPSKNIKLLRPLMKAMQLDKLYPKDMYVTPDGKRTPIPDSVLWAIAFSEATNITGKQDNLFDIIQTQMLWGNVLLNLGEFDTKAMYTFVTILDFSYDVSSHVFEFVCGIPGLFGYAPSMIKVQIDVTKMNTNQLNIVTYTGPEEVVDAELISKIHCSYIDSEVMRYFYPEVTQKLDLKDLSIGSQSDKIQTAQMERIANQTQMMLETVIQDLEDKGFKRMIRTKSINSSYFSVHLSAWLNKSEFVSLNKQINSGKTVYRLDTYRDGKYYLSIEGNFNEEAFINYFNFRSALLGATQQQDSDSAYILKCNAYQQECYNTNKNLLTYPENYFSFTYMKGYNTWGAIEKRSIDGYAIADFLPTNEVCIVARFALSLTKRTDKKIIEDRVGLRQDTRQVAYVILMRFTDSKEAMEIFDKLKKKKLLSKVTMPEEAYTVLNMVPDDGASHYSNNDTENLAYIAIRSNVNNSPQDALLAELNI